MGISSLRRKNAAQLLPIDVIAANPAQMRATTANACFGTRDSKENSLVR
jgi:S-adenosylhomocysteine hydrolase